MRKRSCPQITQIDADVADKMLRRHYGLPVYRYHVFPPYLRPLIDIGRPSRAVPVTPPGIRVTYHGGSTELSVGRRSYSGKVDRVEIAISQCLLNRRVT